MKKKYILLVILTTLLLCPIQTSAQNWFPMEVGNEWQYLKYHSFVSASFSSQSFKLNTYYILKDTLVNQNLYYKWQPSHPELWYYRWIRFDEDSLTLNLLCYNEGNVIMDFNMAVGSDTLLSPYTCYYDIVSIVDMDFNFGDSLIYAKGFSYYDILYSSYSSYYYSVGVGLSKLSIFSDGPGGSVSHNELSLLQARIGNNAYSHNYYPEIILDPVVAISDSLFVLTFEVNHEYNHIFPDSLPHTSLYFIDTVNMHSYYLKGTDLVENEVELAEIISGTALWKFCTTLNMDLMQNGYSFNYRIEAVDKGLFPHRSFSPDTGYYSAVYDTTTDVSDYEYFIVQYELQQNYPNPFNPGTKIKFIIPQDIGGQTQEVSLKVYDVLGNEITTLVNEEKSAGIYEIKFDASGLPSGVYFYKLQTGSFIQVKKMILMK
jgi:hypothetical protein